MQPLNEDYKQKRLVFAQNLKQLINDDGINVKQIFSRFRSKRTVWCDLSATEIFGPIFINENIIGDVYQYLLKSEFLPWFRKKKNREFSVYAWWGYSSSHKTSILFVE